MASTLVTLSDQAKTASSSKTASSGMPTYSSSPSLPRRLE